MENKNVPESNTARLPDNVYRREEVCTFRLRPLSNKSSADCRAYAVTWIYALDTPHGPGDCENRVDLLQGSIDDGDIEPMSEEMWAAFRALAVCYLDALLNFPTKWENPGGCFVKRNNCEEVDWATPELFDQASGNNAGNLGVIAVAAYVGAAKFRGLAPKLTVFFVQRKICPVGVASGGRRPADASGGASRGPARRPSRSGGRDGELPVGHRA